MRIAPDTAGDAFSFFDVNLEVFTYDNKKKSRSAPRTPVGLRWIYPADACSGRESSILEFYGR